MTYFGFNFVTQGNGEKISIDQTGQSYISTSF